MSGLRALTKTGIRGIVYLHMGANGHEDENPPAGGTAKERGRGGATKAPSEDFERAFTSSGSIVVECEFCGRTHFCDREDAGDFEQGELERLREESRKNPGKVMGWDCTSISRIEIDGKEAAECCPCRSVRRYEDWIWRYRTQIAEYLSTRAEADLNAAKAEAERLAIAAKFMGADNRLSDLRREIHSVEEYLDARPKAAADGSVASADIGFGMLSQGALASGAIPSATPHLGTGVIASGALRPWVIQGGIASGKLV